MILLKLFHTTEEGVVRLVSVLSPFLFVVVRLIFGAPFGPDTFIFDIAMATAIILLSPWGEDDIFSLLIIALSTSALGMVGAGLSRVLPCETLALGYAIAVSLPIMVRFALKVYTMLDDKEFLLSQASGWELASTFLNVGIAMSVLCSVMVALCLVAVGAGKVWLYIQAVVSVSLYVFLVVRSLTRRPVLLGSISDKAFRRRLKMSLSFMPPEVPGRYKRLYKAMCLMLEDEKKFLDENYSMDDMSRDLCTNRGQLSKMINMCTGLHFNQMLNGYRVRYSIDLFMKDPSLRVSELANLSGFGNKVSYGMAFKQFMNTTPGEWCDQYLISKGMSPAKVKSSRLVAPRRKRPAGSA